MYVRICFSSLLVIRITHILCHQDRFSYFCIDAATFLLFCSCYGSTVSLSPSVSFSLSLDFFTHPSSDKKGKKFLSLISIPQLNCMIFVVPFSSFWCQFPHTKDANNTKCFVVIANVSPYKFNVITSYFSGTLFSHTHTHPHSSWIPNKKGPNCIEH